jgi:hypothetical protein
VSNRSSSNIISTILRHDTKVTSYKIALLRAINDVALSFPGLGQSSQPVLVPLRTLAEFWVAYYWPFVDPNQPIWQGPRSTRRQGVVTNDMAFRPELTDLRLAWERWWGVVSLPPDGYVIMNEMHVPRKRAQYSTELQEAYNRAIRAISRTLEMPIRHAGPGEWTVFDRPIRYKPSASPGTPIPGTRPNDRCLVIAAEIWGLFRDLSLWIEALCIHEWALFVEQVDQADGKSTDRGNLADTGRRPLSHTLSKYEVLQKIEIPTLSRACSIPNVVQITPANNTEHPKSRKLDTGGCHQAPRAANQPRKSLGDSIQSSPINI